MILLPPCLQLLFKLNFFLIAVKYTKRKIYHLNLFKAYSSVLLSTFTLLSTQSPNSFIIYLFIYLFIYLLAMPRSLRDLSSPTRDWTQGHGSESGPNHWTAREFPPNSFNLAKLKGHTHRTTPHSFLPRPWQPPHSTFVTEQDPMGPSWDRPSPVTSALAPLWST